ncbi:MAG: DHH family phosphoesterase [Parcubacteria group bacterium]|nr:DHH family phosphoesterase [Parcubacteria group bacterium]
MDPLAEKFDEALSRIKSARRILLATHEDPDGDGLGALLAALLWLKDMAGGKEVVALTRGELSSSLLSLPGIEFCRSETPEGPFDLLFGFDYGDFKRLGLDEWISRQPQISTITFDHHPLGRHAGDLLIVDPAAPSTTSLVFRFLSHARASISPAMATCILFGLVVDTGGFMHANTTGEAFSVAGEVMRKGGDLQRAVRAAFRKKDPQGLRLWGEALLRVCLDRESGLAVSRVTADDLKKHKAKRELMVEFSGVLNTIEGARSAVFLSQDSDDAEHIKGSLRSEEYKGVDVSRLALAFGGGGHKLASGFKIEAEWKEVVAKLIDEARKVAIKDNH